MAAEPKPDGLQVPRREQLLAQMESANRWGIPFLFIQVCLLAGCALFIDWHKAIRDPLLATVVIAAVVGPYAMSILRHLAQKKKEIGDLKEQTHFGQFDKHRLRSLFEETQRRLNLPAQRIPVYIVADKNVNAMMLHTGLGGLLKSMNGVYLHRQTLHKLNAEEVQDIMGHELGHYYRYYFIADRFRILTLMLGAFSGLAIAQGIGVDNFALGTFVLLFWVAAFWRIASIPQARLAWTVEYLCDDLGAQVHGVVVSINGLMKIGAEWEVLTAVQRHAALSAYSNNLNAQEIGEAIAAAIPYGHTSRAELEAAVEKTLKQSAQQGPSLSGFLRYMWQSDVDAENDQVFEQEMLKLRALEKVPRIPWETLMSDPREICFNERSLEALVELIEGFPSAALFHTPEALGQAEASHPPMKQRILYLWHNRTAIEQLRRS